MAKRTSGEAADAGGTDPGAAPASTSYEEARDALAGIVGALEAGGLPLEESLALWERGEQLAAECERWLAGARERLERGTGAPGAGPG